MIVMLLLLNAVNRMAGGPISELEFGVSFWAGRRGRRGPGGADRWLLRGEG